jgi:AcrR family transcriptional regulator
VRPIVGQNLGMTSPGLRERKKQKTRWAIQEHALRLIAEQGYEATTVDQIAAAAEISPSTFFRYFPTKEDLIIEDEYDALMLHGLSTLDSSVPPMDAVRQIICTALAAMTEHERDKILERSKLILSVPALRSRSLENFTKTVDLLAGVMARRTGLAADSVEILTFAGAVIGALTSVIFSWVTSGGEGDLVGRVDRSLALVAAGLPLDH